jgi:hypothetical protein
MLRSLAASRGEQLYDMCCCFLLRTTTTCSRTVWSTDVQQHTKNAQASSITQPSPLKLCCNAGQNQTTSTIQRRNSHRETMANPYYEVFYLQNGSRPIAAYASTHQMDNHVPLSNSASFVKYGTSTFSNFSFCPLAILRPLSFVEEFTMAAAILLSFEPAADLALSQWRLEATNTAQSPLRRQIAPP